MISSRVIKEKRARFSSRVETSGRSSLISDTKGKKRGCRKSAARSNRRFFGISRGCFFRDTRAVGKIQGAIFLRLPRCRLRASRSVKKFKNTRVAILRPSFRAFERRSRQLGQLEKRNWHVPLGRESVEEARSYGRDRPRAPHNRPRRTRERPRQGRDLSVPPASPPARPTLAPRKSISRIPVRRLGEAPSGGTRSRGV